MLQITMRDYMYKAVVHMYSVYSMLISCAPLELHTRLIRHRARFTSKGINSNSSISKFAARFHLCTGCGQKIVCMLSLLVLLRALSLASDGGVHGATLNLQRDAYGMNATKHTADWRERASERAGERVCVRIHWAMWCRHVVVCMALYAPNNIISSNNENANRIEMIK